MVACLPNENRLENVGEEDTFDQIDMNPTEHKSWRVALYYCYIDLSNVSEQVRFHRHLCKTLSLNGRIRVSSEGLNGVLTGLFSDLQQYEAKVLEQLQILCPHDSKMNMIDLDVKYCFLREDLPSKSRGH